MFSTLSKTEIIIFVTFNLSSANAYNLVWSKILSCGNGLRNEFEPMLLNQVMNWVSCPETIILSLYLIQGRSPVLNGKFEDCERVRGSIEVSFASLVVYSVLVLAKVAQTRKWL